MSMMANAAFLPVSEALSRCIVLASETIHAASDVLYERENLMEVTKYLEKIKPILRELSHKKFTENSTVYKSIGVIERELIDAKAIISTCSSRSKFYLLINCRNILKKLQTVTKEIGHALSLLPLSLLDAASDIQEKTSVLCKEMQNVELKAAIAEEEVIEKIEFGIRERHNDGAYANNLLLQIAKAVGIPLDTSVLKSEFEEFKKDMEETKLRKNQAEALQMEQIIGILSWADATSSPRERDKIYHQKKISLGTNPLPPLQSFYCPISNEVMEDPVEISSGQTFERSSIEKWFEEGHATCPLSNKLLVTKELRPNIILRRSIDEWKDRNTMSMIASLRPNLDFTDENTVLVALDKLQEYSEEKDVHKHWIAAEGYIPVLIGLLRRNKPIVRKRALALLHSLVEDNNGNKERVLREEHALDSIVQLLGRDISEGSKAAVLLLELSKNKDVCEKVGKVQGCFFLLSTMSSSDNPQAAKAAHEILERLSYSEEYIIQMAKANYFKPLVILLIEGPNEVKTLMANALSEMSLTDKHKALLVKQNIMPQLIEMLSNEDSESRLAAIGAVETLSSSPVNTKQMIEQGVVRPVLDFLCMKKSVLLPLREKAANTYLNLAMSQNADETTIQALLETDEVIQQLLSCISLTPPSIQASIIRAFYAICCVSAATDIRAKLKEQGAIQLLLPLLESSKAEIRSYAIKLLYKLSQEENETDFVNHLGQAYTTSLVKLLSAPLDDEEKAAILGIIANLPSNNKQITQWLLAAGILDPILYIISQATANSYNSAKNELIENATGALCRFTLPDDINMQQKLASTDVISFLVSILRFGTSIAKSKAAISLAQFSKSSTKLSKPIKSKKKLSSCFSPSSVSQCIIHRGMCSVRMSFCLLEADSVDYLVKMLGEREDIALKAALEALSTILCDDSLENGVKLLEEAGAIRYIIKLLSVESRDVQEKAVWIMERVFRVEKYRGVYGHAAQMPLVDITQKGTLPSRSLAARSLSHLKIIHEQSSYF